MVSPGIAATKSVMVDRNMHLGQSELCNNSINKNDILITRLNSLRSCNWLKVFRTSTEPLYML